MAARLRPAIAADAETLAALYGPHVLHGTGTFEEVPPDAAEMARRLEAVTARGWPWLLIEDEDGPAGFGYAAQYRDRIGYRYTAEDSIYLRPDRIGRGYGRLLLSAVIEDAAAAGFQRLFAVIGDSGNAASIGLHGALGFARAGCFTRAGVKFGRWIDIVLMERDLP
jgi:phosphinothricin acetyltransferase